MPYSDKEDSIGKSMFTEVLSAAVQVGLGDAEASSISRTAQEQRLVDADRLLAVAPVRVMAVLGDIPYKVRSAVAHAMRWESEVIVPVMELSEFEYPGDMPRSPFSLPKESLTVADLRCAGLFVFIYLSEVFEKTKNYEPTIFYHYNGDIRRYSIQLAVKVTIEPSAQKPDYLG